MKKVLLIFLAVFLICIQSFAEPENRIPNEPINRLIKTALDSNPEVFDKNSSVKNYFNAFIPNWKNLLAQLFSQESTQDRVESFFSQNHEITQKMLPAFQKMKPPAELKNFHEVFLKGVEELSEWCLGIKNRIHFAKTDYQKKAYTERIQSFQSEWYETFFGEAFDELNSALSAFVVSHWKDALNPSQLKALQSSKTTLNYLTNFHRVIGTHLNAAADMSRKNREAKEKYRDSDRPDISFKYLKSELDDLKKTRANLIKLIPPEPFKNFHTLQLAWIDSAIHGSEKLMELGDASRKGLPDEKIQALMNERNQFELESNRLKANADKAYKEALDLASQSTAFPPENPGKQLK